MYSVAGATDTVAGSDIADRDGGKASGSPHAPARYRAAVCVCVCACACVCVCSPENVASRPLSRIGMYIYAITHTHTHTNKHTHTHTHTQTHAHTRTHTHTHTHTQELTSSATHAAPMRAVLQVIR